MSIPFMASFFQGYGYDIISYRLKDNINNKGDHCVKEFAHVLESGIEVLFKEAVNYRIK